MSYLLHFIIMFADGFQNRSIFCQKLSMYFNGDSGSNGSVTGSQRVKDLKNQSVVDYPGFEAKYKK